MAARKKPAPAPAPSPEEAQKAPPSPEVPSREPSLPPPEGAEEARAKSYVIAPGKSLTSSRGVLGPGAPVDFLSPERLSELVIAGYVIEQ